MLYKQVYDSLKEAIQGGKYPTGSKLPTTAQLRERYSVSVITVRKALDMLRDEGYITRQPRIGTTVISTNPTQAPHTEGLPTLSVIISSFNDVFGTEVLRGILKAARGKARIQLSSPDGNQDYEEEDIAGAKDSNAQGLILLPNDSVFIPSTVLELISHKFPLTIVDRRFEGIPVATVTSDNVNGAKDATDYLISLGHRHIALLTSGWQVTSNDERRMGWEMAHARANIRLDDDLVFSSHALQPRTNEDREQGIAELKKFITAHPETTAYLAGEYSIAVLLRAALESLGKKIPEDASIICFDHPDVDADNELFHFTSVMQDQAKLGAEAVTMTLDQIKKGANTNHVVVPTTLVKGESTRKL